ncbi:hypothetical protein C8R47DRAFT_1284732 [Mycena vitilis]|nr:hypothetical protein C8R47DRAFT_1284732 [Mycena vitilis]
MLIDDRSVSWRDVGFVPWPTAPSRKRTRGSDVSPFKSSICGLEARPRESDAWVTVRVSGRVAGGGRRASARYWQLWNQSCSISRNSNWTGYYRSNTLSLLLPSLKRSSAYRCLTFAALSLHLGVRGDTLWLLKLHEGKGCCVAHNNRRATAARANGVACPRRTSVVRAQIGGDPSATSWIVGNPTEASQVPQHPPYFLTSKPAICY